MPVDGYFPAAGGARASPAPTLPPPLKKSSHRDDSPQARERKSSRAKSPLREKSRSPSPRTKRLKKAQAERVEGDVEGRRRERDMEKYSEREYEKSHGRGKHRERDTEQVTERERGRSHERVDDKRERGADRENGADRKERRSRRDDNGGKSSKARNGRSASPSDHHHRSRHRSPSPSRHAEKRDRDEVMNSRGSEQRDDDDDSLAKMKAAEEALEAKQKQKPSFELSGKLASETNRVRGVTLLFTEPPEARKPDIRWRLYVFKAGEVLNEPLYIHRQSCYLFGRERRVADIPTDHPSCSKQHAVIQFRQVEKENPDGTLFKQVKPYIMDLGSTNKTFINDNPIEPQRYYELFEKDTIKFGNSSREYVLLHENSASAT